jgi:hypothetical protein
MCRIRLRYWRTSERLFTIKPVFVFNLGMSAPSTQTLAPTTLATTDRCDRCGAQAYVLAELPGGSQLLFCGHHWSTHEAALRPKVVNIIDELHRLNDAP